MATKKSNSKKNNGKKKKNRGPKTTPPAKPPYFAIPGDLAQATLNYLISQPYSAVADLIAGFKELQIIEIEPDEPATDDADDDDEDD